MKRRNFLKYGCLSTLACGSSVALNRSTGTAMEPIKRPQPSQLRLSLAAYSFRKYLQPNGDKPAEMDLFEFVDFCHQNGLAGTELTSYYFPATVDDAYLLKLKRHCHLRGVSISGGAIRNDFCQADPVAVARDLEHTRQWIDHYAKLGAPAIRIFAGQPVAEEEPSKTLTRCAKICQIACDDAAKQGVILALENHGGVTARPQGLIEIVEQVDSPAFGVNFDSGNFHSTDDPYAELEMIAPYAVNAQIKVEMQVKGETQPADLNRIIQILRGVDYSGWVALEYESETDPFEAVPKWLKQLEPLVDG
ncbi:MAG: sugar phosphate isomerase/epimerase family protein [Aureliella sp.]